ncbi:MAG: WYL domain-containing protein, partial [Panacibacter sp.]
SIVEKKVLHIQYTAFHSDETTERDVEPVGIFYANGYWHAIAYCRLRKDYRDFRADRINKIKTTDEIFHKAHPSLKTYLEQMMQQQKLEKIVINVNKEAAKYLLAQKLYYGFVDEKKVDDMIQMTFLSAYPESFVRWYITFADNAQIIYPDSLQQQLKKFISAMAERIL